MAATAAASKAPTATIVLVPSMFKCEREWETIRTYMLGGSIWLCSFFPSCSYNYIHCLAFSCVYTIFLCVNKYTSRSTNDLRFFFILCKHIKEKKFNVNFSFTFHSSLNSCFFCIFNLCSLTRASSNELLRYR